MLFRLSFVSVICAFLVSPVVCADDMLQAVPYAIKAPVIDGVANDAVWNSADWRPLDQLMAGSMPTSDDFSGRYKLTWDKGALFILVEITDDKLVDQHANPLFNYWDDDCLEIFIDEDASGGLHQFDYNAFAYHVALDNQAVDIGPEREPNVTNFLTLNDHVKSVWNRSPQAPNKIIWEVALTIYDQHFDETKDTNDPVELGSGKIMGFMLAYCDNDGSDTREHFMGSEQIKPVNGDRNRGYIDASVFGKIRLVK